MLEAAAVSAVLHTTKSQTGMPEMQGQDAGEESFQVVTYGVCDVAANLANSDCRKMLVAVVNGFAQLLSGCSEGREHAEHVHQV